MLCRLEGLLYATGVAYSEEAGVLLDDNTLDLALAFTDSVPGLRASMFTVSGPRNMTTTELEPVDGSDAYFTFSVTVPESYYGSLTVSMNRVSIALTQQLSRNALTAPCTLMTDDSDKLLFRLPAMQACYCWSCSCVQLSKNPFAAKKGLQMCCQADSSVVSEGRAG